MVTQLEVKSKKNVLLFYQKCNDLTRKNLEETLEENFKATSGTIPLGIQPLIDGNT